MYWLLAYAFVGLLVGVSARREGKDVASCIFTAVIWFPGLIAVALGLLDE